MKIALGSTATVVRAKGQGGEGRRFGSVPTGITTHISPKPACGGGGRDAFIPAHTLRRVCDRGEYHLQQHLLRSVDLD